MTIGAAFNKVAQAQNGIGAFMLQCRKLDFHYCDWAGSSKGMNAFIKHKLPQFARENPQIEITVSPRPNHHPLVRGEYINGKQRSICVKKLEPDQVLQKVNLLRNASGELNKRTTQKVISKNESVRGIWSPYHVKDVLQRWTVQQK